MTIDEAYSIISHDKPPIIYISGKTSTGKSTFGRKLRDELDYTIIEIEAVLLEIIKSHQYDEQSTFRAVLSDPDDSEAKKLFLKEIHIVIADILHQNKPVVIEGAVANTETLRRILDFNDTVFFLYFHPISIDIYIRNLTQRFMESSADSYGGLPMKFWQMINKDEFATFCKNRQITDGLHASIRQYALASQAESLTRLAECRQYFDTITLIEIS